jgi:hypothetical protein
MISRFLKCSLFHAAAPTVEHPPFEPMPDSYSPGSSGVALYFTDTGQQGRHMRRHRNARCLKEQVGSPLSMTSAVSNTIGSYLILSF